MKPAFLTIGTIALVCALAATDRVRAQADGLTGAAQIAHVYDTILDARFEQVPDLLRQTCGGPPPAALTRPPAAVCQLLDVVSLWWQIQLDPLSTSHDQVFDAKVGDTIAAMEAWTRAEPRRAEAWFYLGGAYGARGQWRVLRGQIVSAARDGKRIKDALERALALDRTLTDAYFGIGLYHYYADVAPAAAKVLRFLLFLPGGDRVQGLREMLQARNGGQILRSEADYQLHVLYLWYERQPLRARQLVADLRSRHPRNPHFYQVLAEINDTYLHDDGATLRAWQELYSAATEGRVARAGMAEAYARLGMAAALDRLHESDRALDLVQSVVEAKPSAPYGSRAQAQLMRGQFLDRLGRRPEAVVAYRDALALVEGRDPLNVASRARLGLRSSPNADAARAYRLSIDGWRALERGRLDEAERLLGQSLSIRPDEMVAKFRLARLKLAQRDTARALLLLEQVATAERGSVPPVLQGYACLDAAVALEQAGARTRANEMYLRATRIFGVDERSKETAERALVRLGLSRP